MPFAAGCQVPLPGKYLNQEAPVSSSWRVFCLFFLVGRGGSPVALKQVNKQKWAKNETL